ncbi:MAG: tRNA sulfurtransferase [Myxococcota bacterium]
MNADTPTQDADQDLLMRPHLVVHPSGEIYIKSSRTRRRFHRLLADHVRTCLTRSAPQTRLIDRKQNLRVVGEDLDAASQALSRVFGVHRVTMVHPIQIEDLDSLADTVGALAIESVRGRTFAVRVRRKGTHTWSSLDASLAIARRLFDVARGVDLTNPERTVKIEVRQDIAYLVTEQWDGPRGLPSGGQERSLSLISGGFDSPVATWMMMRRGSQVDFIHFTLECSQSEHALGVAHALREQWGSGPSPIFWRVDFQPAREALLEFVESRYRQVVLKQLMIATADALADRLGIHALITGDSVGQVSSQTLSHLAAIDRYANRSVIRPLAGMLKEEIIDWSRRIGTASISERAKEVCDLSDGPVAVFARWARLEEAHKCLPPEIISEALSHLDAVALDDWMPGLPFVKVISEAPSDRPTVTADMVNDTEGPIAVTGRHAARAASRLTTEGRDVLIVLRPDKTVPFEISA